MAREEELTECMDVLGPAQQAAGPGPRLKHSNISVRVRQINRQVEMI